MTRLAPPLASLAFVVAAAACNHAASNYCKDVPVTHNCMDDADTGCSSNMQCASPTPVCDVDGTKTCVQCTTSDASACIGATPVCGASNTCQGCTMHAQCSSKACLPDGSCGTDSNVAYVDPTGTDNTQCTKAMPCTKVAKALLTGRAFVKFTGSTDEQVSVTSQNVTMLADGGAKLTSTSNGILMKVDGTSQLSIYDLELTGASGASNPGISMQPGNAATLSLHRVKVTNNQGGGIVCNGGSLAVSQSVVSGNQGGGISVTGTGATFDITNSFIYRNGNNTSATFGGIDIGVTSPGASRLEFNTIVDNLATAGPLNAGGVLCSATSFAGANNIIARNLVGASTTDSNSQTLGACTYPTSVVASTVTSLAFVRADSSPFDYHLTTGSSAIDQALTSSSIVTDYDGDVRPQGPQKDIGADEFH